MIYGISHVELQVSSLASARVFYADHVGFPVLAAGPHSLELDAGSLSLLIRLEEEPLASSPGLRLQVESVVAARDLLLAGGGACLQEPFRTPERHVEARVADPDGNVLVLWRHLSEDEYETPPELVRDRAWDAEAQTLLQALLGFVPAPWRGLARKRSTAMAEGLAAAQESDVVTRRLAARAYVRSTPSFMRNRTRAPLEEHGFDPADFLEDYSS